MILCKQLTCSSAIIQPGPKRVAKTPVMTLTRILATVTRVGCRIGARPKRRLRSSIGSHPVRDIYLLIILRAHYLLSV